MRGIWPSALVRGRRVSSTLVTALLVHLVIAVSNVTSRRHLPTWMTSGTFAPEGTPDSVKWPFTSVSAAAIGEPAAKAAQASQVTPSAIGGSGSGSFGT